jgi:N-acetylmuramoyl-L-alanine amidase
MEEPINTEEVIPEPENSKKRIRKPKTRQVNQFGFWRGLFTSVGVALVVATLFTIWTPASLVESSISAQLDQALESAAEENLPADELASDPDALEIANRIGIVAGHYGDIDPGAVCDNGAKEVDFNLEIATLVQKKLTDLGYEVDLLEEFDTRLDGYQAAVVVSIHLDSCVYINDQATGYKVAAALANQDLAASQRLTACLSQRYGEITGLPYHAGSVTPDMTNYHVYNEIAPETNAAIIEAGFMNRDYQFITEKTEIIADGIVAGILCFVNNESIQITPTP